jgi:hypothetical protein
VLPSAEDLDGLLKYAITQRAVLAPVTLPTQEMLHSAGIGSEAVDSYRNANMMTAAWSAIHDQLVKDQVESLGLDLDGFLFGIGKHWISGATPGWARLKGWWTGSRWIQNGIYPQYVHPAHEFHDDMYCDYSSSVLVKRA